LQFPLRAIGSTSGGTGIGESALVAISGAKLSSSRDKAIDVGLLGERLVLLSFPGLGIGPGRGGVTTRGEAVAEGGEVVRGLTEAVLKPNVFAFGVGGTIPIIDGDIG